MKTKIEKLASELINDLNKLKKDKPVEEYIGVEIMALNAICNAEKTISKQD